MPPFPRGIGGGGGGGGGGDAFTENEGEREKAHLPSNSRKSRRRREHPRKYIYESGEYVISRLMGLEVFHFLLSFTHTKIRSDRKNFGGRTTSQNPDLQETEGEILLTA